MEVQSDWIVGVIEGMREKGLKKINPTEKAEQQWRDVVKKLSAMGLRDKVDSWWNGANIPGKLSSVCLSAHSRAVLTRLITVGKPREPLNYAGGIPLYLATIQDVKEKGYRGFNLQ